MNVTTFSQKIFSNFKKIIITSKQKQTPLGRWALDYNSIDKKVDFANEDHCGECNYYRLTKINDLKIINE